jgi:hypothetical protein
MKSALLLAFLLGLTSSAFAQDRPAQDERRNCHILRGAGSSFLEDCGDRLHSFTLAFNDSRHMVDRDQQGRFSFLCTFGPMCVNEPKISGFFIKPEEWNNGAKDEAAIIAAFQGVPLMSGAWSRPAVQPAPPPATCPVFDVAIDNLEGRAACYGGAEGKWSAVVIVVADDRVGIVLSFFQADHDAEAVRSKVLALVPKFGIQRASGDAGLKGWIR